jgi:hypothetical protein
VNLVSERGEDNNAKSYEDLGFDHGSHCVCILSAAAAHAHNEGWQDEGARRRKSDAKWNAASRPPALGESIAGHSGKHNV